jgi:hypothetical protein
MGEVHSHATVSPSKQELVESWLPSRPWAAGRTISGKVAEYRFDDPDGEVGVETILWTCDDGSVLQTPLTYRSAPLPGAEAHLVGTADHSVLGRRWVYDGCADPVWFATLADAIVHGGTQVQMYFEQDGRRIDVPPRMRVRGSGGGDDVRAVGSVDEVVDRGPVTLARAGGAELAVVRVVGTPLPDGPHLVGRVGDHGEPVVLAMLAHRTDA